MVPRIYTNRDALMITAIFMASAMLTIPACLMMGGFIQIGGQAQPFLVVAMLLIAFSLPMLLPPPGRVAETAGSKPVLDQPNT